MNEETETPKPADVAGPLDEIVGRAVEALKKHDCIRPWLGILPWAIIPEGIDGKTCRERGDVPVEKWCCICLALEVLTPNAGIQPSERSEDRLE
jgi:hypothetical protein